MSFAAPVAVSQRVAHAVSVSSLVVTLSPFRLPTAILPRFSGPDKGSPTRRDEPCRAPPSGLHRSGQGSPCSYAAAGVHVGVGLPCHAVVTVLLGATGAKMPPPVGHGVGTTTGRSATSPRPWNAKSTSVGI